MRQKLSKFILLLTMVAGLTMNLPVAGASTLNSAIDRFNIQDYKGAIAQWEQLARMGDPNALFNLGQVYRLGTGVIEDMARAEYFYRRAAEAGHVEAQNNLATLYFFDSANTTRKGEALTWWRMAARHGYGPAQYMLAVLHYNGEYLPKDNIQAFAWVVLAREAGVEAAKTAERVMRQNLSVNEMTQGRLLSRGLVEVKIDGPDLNVNIPDPMGGEGGKTNMNELPLVASNVPAPKAPDSPSGVSSPPTPNAPSSTLSPPQAREVVRHTPATTGQLEGWRLQLGSFRSEDKPNAFFDNLLKNYPDIMAGLSGEVSVADLGARGVFYRLIIGGFESKVDAQDRCNIIKTAGFDCILVAP